MKGSVSATPDKNQRVRLQRLFLATAASAVAVVLSFIIAAAGYLPYEVAVRYAAMVFAMVALFFVLIQTGLNLRFADPGLTVPQLVVAALATSYLLYHGSAARPAATAVFLMAFMFGMFMLDRRRLIGVALFYFACYGVVVCLIALDPIGQKDLRREVFRLIFFGVLLAWSTVLGSYMEQLRKKLRVANDELAYALAEAHNIARRDPLTGCYNRRYAMEQLEIEVKRASRGSALSLCLADLDAFKSINDTLGHGVGDEVLKLFAGAASAMLRPTDFVARFGGEEFLFVFSGTDRDGAAAVAERIRRAAEKIRIQGQPDGRRITVSIGIAEHQKGDTIDDTLARADGALYQAKRDGANRVVLAS
jgi:diguanylate cyclase (GGDEF)-like protein